MLRLDRAAVEGQTPRSGVAVPDMRASRQRQTRAGMFMQTDSRRSAVKAGNMTERAEKTKQAIERGEVAELLKLIEFPACACRGAEGDEPLCRCRMTAKQVQDAVSYYALRHGKLIRLKQP